MPQKEKWKKKIKNMPFTKTDFFLVFKTYNTAVGMTVWLFYLVAGLCLYALYTKRKFASKLTFGLLSFLWLWMGAVYHWMFFSPINPVAKFFAAAFVVEAAVLGIASIKNVKLSLFPVSTSKGAFQAFCALYALLIYPLIGLLMGHAYPNGPIFGLPCPTTIFTFAILTGVGESRLSTLSLSAIPILWALIGTSAAALLGVPEDFVLGFSALGFIWLIFISPSLFMTRRNYGYELKEKFNHLLFLLWQ